MKTLFAILIFSASAFAQYSAVPSSAYPTLDANLNTKASGNVVTSDPATCQDGHDLIHNTASVLFKLCGTGNVWSALALTGVDISSVYKVTGINGLAVPSSVGVAGYNASAQPVASVAANVISLWSGTCNSGSVLGGAGACVINASLTANTFTGQQIISVANAAALVVGPNGTTNPALTVATNVSSAATGLSITGNAAGSGVTIGVTSSASTEEFFLKGKGSLSGELESYVSAGGGILVVSRSDTPTTRYVSLGNLAGGAFPGVATSGVGGYFWTSSTDSALAPDTAICRAAANTIEVGYSGGCAQNGQVNAGNALFTAAAPTVAASQVGIGGTVTANTNCGILASSAGCLVINVAGTTRYIPYY